MPKKKKIKSDEDAVRELEARAGCCKGKGCCAYCFNAIGSWTGLTACCCSGVGGGAQVTSINKSNRFCTDCPCLILLVASITLQVLLMYLAYNDGADPYWLVNYTDFNGELCNDEHPEGHLGAYPDVRYPMVVVCVKRCNVTNGDDERFVEVTSLTKGYASTEFMGRMCAPDWDIIAEVATNAAEKAFDVLDDFTTSAKEMFDDGIGDIVECRNVIIVSAFVTMILCYLWGTLVQKFGKTIVWTSLMLGIGLVFCVGYFIYDKSQAVIDSGYADAGNYMWYIGVAIMGLDTLFFLSICCMADRINIAINILKEASVANLDMPVLNFIPICGFILGCCWFLFWIMSFLYTISVFENTEVELPTAVGLSSYFSGWDDSWSSQLHSLHDTLGDLNTTVRPHGTYIQQDYSELFFKFAIYEVFLFLWVLQFIIYLSYMIVSGAYAEWYFSDWKDRKNIRKGKRRGSKPGQLSRFPVCGSIYRCIRYHMGSLATGAALIATIQMLRLGMIYVEKQVNSQNPNPFQKVLIRSIHCLLWCLQCLFDRLNKSGFVITSIYGTPFCVSSVQALVLMLGNLIRVAALHVVSGYLSWMGSFFIVGGTCATCGFIIRYTEIEEKLSSIVYPMIIICLLSYLLCAIYMMVFQVGIDTMFMCFLIDEKVNKGKHMFASNNLLKLINETAEESLMDAAQLQKSMTYRRDSNLKELRREETAENEMHTMRMTTIRTRRSISVEMQTREPDTA